MINLPSGLVGGAGLPL